jgi:hypothetical protein
VSINRNSLKTYAPKARQDFIAAVSARAAKFGIGENDTVSMQEQGDVVIIGDEAFPKKIGAQRKALLGRINLHGFNQVMEEVAYTWFNRFLAIRYMEIHGYLDHGYRVLSNPDGSEIPEILQHAEHVDLTALNKTKVVDLKLDGTKDAELYRLLLIGQCNALHDSMPFLFEKIDDETELLLPDNLLHSDSLIRQLVNEIDEANWQEIEIIGWLYQFYISEKKDQVIGKVVKSEDIPAATQLFTPNWIVKYMVQNSLGHQWMATYPSSSLKDGMEYYIEPAEQTPEVQAQLAEITPKELSPEELTLLDPAVGSGHILVEAYDLFKEIYLERGYRLKDIPRLILEKNLYGLDIDDRAAQMAGFALLMKARADDRRILSNPVHLNVMAIRSSEGLDAADIAKNLLVSDSSGEVKAGTIESLINLFEDAKTFGSLITVPDNIQKALRALKQLLDQPSFGDLLQRQMRENAVKTVRPLILQATMMGRQYNIIVANPPYMGSKGMNDQLGKWVKDNYPESKSDLFAMFVQRCVGMCVPLGRMAFVTPYLWMFIGSFERFRNSLIRNQSITSLVQLEYNAFGPAVVPVCTFSIQNFSSAPYNGTFIKLSEFTGEKNQAPRTLEAITNKDCRWKYFASSEGFLKIPGGPISYWVSEKIQQAFSTGLPLNQIMKPRQGLATADNERFLRRWYETSIENTTIFRNDDTRKWYPHTKGGVFRRWYGNNEWTINWKGNGREIKGFNKSVIRNESDYLKGGFSWSDLTSSYFNSRHIPEGYIFDTAGPTCISIEGVDNKNLLAFSNSKVFQSLVNVSLQGMHYSNGVIGVTPINPRIMNSNIQERQLIALSKTDWDDYETSWDFTTHPLMRFDTKRLNIKTAYEMIREAWNDSVQKVKALEEHNNSIFIDIYNLQEELTPGISLEEVTLSCNPNYRYRGEATSEKLEERLRADTIKQLISYAIGCMMGRYSLAEEGLIYANSENEGFDPLRYGDFPADDDGIIPITDTEWFDDDATVRFEEFLKVAWSPETLKGNLKFIGDSLANNGGNDPLKTIRNYLSKAFYKDHLKTYKKRPIYWLFSSGKQRAFECLVYLHRYNDGTLARMRMEYVTPLQSRIFARIHQLTGDVESAPSSAERSRKQKEKDRLVKQLEELRAFDEELRHYADQRITLNLDDGVKVNYGPFGNLLAEKRLVVGKATT